MEVRPQGAASSDVDDRGRESMRRCRERIAISLRPVERKTTKESRTLTIRLRTCSTLRR